MSRPISGGDIIVQVLADEGVDTVFGYSGGAILPTYDAVFRYNELCRENGRREIQLIVPASEQGAGFMAAGYARSTGKVGVFMVTSGPGATNSVTPIRDCMADSVPVVLITGQVPRAALGSDAFQEAPVFNLMSTCAKHAFLVTKPEELEATMRTAFEIARSGRPGPVVVDIPKDVQNWMGPYAGSGVLTLRGYDRRIREIKNARISPDHARAFFDLLKTSERPLIYAGGGVINSGAAEELRRFAAAFGVPVVTTLMGLGAMDSTDPLSLHMLGMHGAAYANYAVEDCDFLIAVASRFDDRVAGNPKQFAPSTRAIAHIDIDAAELGKVKSAHWGHVGDAKAALNDLLAAANGFQKDYSAWRAHLERLRKKHAHNYDRTSSLIQPQQVMEKLNEIVKGDAIFTTGVGQHQMWAAQYLEIRNPRSWLTSGSMGTMGFGLPAAIGAQFACPDRTVINIDGDGSIRMNFGDLETVTTYNVPVKILVLNNNGDGMVRQWQRLYFAERFSGSDKSLHKKDFIKAAEADGFEFAVRVSDAAELPRVLKEFVEFKGPAFLEVVIDQNACVYPMIGPGAGYKEMVTGSFIVQRQASEVAVEAGKPDLF
ncbi:MAG TPA: biosynthetic-type acetolactate synthase large subunit [Terriglobia bacterium]|nr:biosynthetic-type acetolactate synthase large subunit [Terriglobia bacterium]